MNYDHLLRAHRCRAIAEAIEREPVPPSGDREVDIEAQAIRAVAVAHLRKCAQVFEANKLCPTLAGAAIDLR